MVQNGTGADGNRLSDEQGICKTVIERSRDRPDRCTIYDTDVTGGMSDTRWLTATEGAFVFSELMR